MKGKIILLFLVWVGVTNSMNWQELIVGLIVSFTIVYFFTDRDNDVSIINLIKKYIKFIPTFLKNLIKSNIEVAKIVLSPKIEVNPAIVKLNTKLESDFDTLILANSITLTPGTLTIELKGKDIYIHILNFKDRETLQKEIIEEFELVIK